MDTIVQWATILSPIIAVLLAWWASRSSAKDTAKQISCICDVAILQIDTTIFEIENEFFKTESTMREHNEEIKDLRSELESLCNSRASEPQRQEFLDKIEKLSKESQWQKAWWMKLFHIQSQLSFAKSRLIDSYKRGK